MKKRKLWTESDLRILKDQFPDIYTAEVSVMLNRSYSSVAKMAARMGLYKSELFKQNELEKQGERLRKAGVLSRFKKGNRSHNKGKPMCPEVYNKVKDTFLKKGQEPHNTKHDGYVSIRLDKASGRKYKHIRVSKGFWKMLHVYNWEQANGKVPSGNILIFKNGNTMDCDLSNIVLISRLEHVANTRNSDGYIAKILAMSEGLGKGRYNADLKDSIIQHPELMDLKRTQLKLQQTIKETQHGKS